MYIYTIKDNDEPATEMSLRFWKPTQRKFLKNTLNLEYKPINAIIIRPPAIGESVRFLMGLRYKKLNSEEANYGRQRTQMNSTTEVQAMLEELILGELLGWRSAILVAMSGVIEVSKIKLNSWAS